MLPILALQPKPHESFLDVCASPGSKTGQAAAMMENSGFVLANDKDLGRIIILNSNLERMGVMNQIVTQADAILLCQRLEKLGMKFDKILVDAPCSGEGTMRSSSGTFTMWNINMVRKLSRLQRRIAESALKLLKPDGEMIYSTCTHSPEENEEVVQYLINKYDIKVEKINLPLKCRPGITGWDGEKFSDELKHACRIYPQDNDTEGFFLCKMKLGEGK
jgi:NOL1/NOP2/sun family putative RNA methylase